MYQRHHVGNKLGHGHEGVAYFPNYKAALILTARWNSPQWVYEIYSVSEVADDPSMWHPDVLQYRYLWKDA